MDIIDETTAVIERVTAQSRDLFSELAVETLNWQPAPQRWSAGQCLEHMIAAHSAYFPIFDQMRRGVYRTRAWERVPLLPFLFGRSLVEGLSGEAARMMKAAKIFQPSQSAVPADIIPRFYAHQEELVEYIRGLREEDLGRVITSPVTGWVVYSLRDACRVIAAHETLHFNQITRTLALYHSVIGPGLS